MAAPDLPRSHRESVQRIGIEFPVAAVEITMDIAGTDLRFGPRQTESATSVFTGS
jgi:hypothetical protein